MSPQVIAHEALGAVKGWGAVAAGEVVAAAYGAGQQRLVIAQSHVAEQGRFIVRNAERQLAGQQILCREPLVEIRHAGQIEHRVAARVVLNQRVIAMLQHGGNEWFQKSLSGIGGHFAGRARRHEEQGVALGVFLHRLQQVEKRRQIDCLRLGCGILSCGNARSQQKTECFCTRLHHRLSI